MPDELPEHGHPELVALIQQTIAQNYTNGAVPPHQHAYSDRDHGHEPTLPDHSHPLEQHRHDVDHDHPHDHDYAGPIHGHPHEHDYSNLGHTHVMATHEHPHDHEYAGNNHRHDLIPHDHAHEHPASALADHEHPHDHAGIGDHDHPHDHDYSALAHSHPAPPRSEGAPHIHWLKYSSTESTHGEHREVYSCIVPGCNAIFAHTPE